jgi:hypothetical protein
MNRKLKTILINLSFILGICLFIAALYVVVDKASNNIPSEPRRLETYRVASNETLWDIGSKYAGDFDVRRWIDITKDINGIEYASDLRSGQKIMVEDWRK